MDEIEIEKRSDHPVEYDYYYPKEIFVVLFLSRREKKSESKRSLFFLHPSSQHRRQRKNDHRIGVLIHVDKPIDHHKLRERRSDSKQVIE